MHSKLVTQSDISSNKQKQIAALINDFLPRREYRQNYTGKLNGFLVLTMAICMRQLRLRYQADWISVDVKFKNQGSKYSFHWSYHESTSILSGWGYHIIT